MKVDSSFLERVREGEDWHRLGRCLESLPRAERGEEACRFFRLLLLQHWLVLDDEALVAEVEDRLSLRRFCGMAPGDAVATAGQVRRFRDLLARAGCEGLVDEVVSRWIAPAAAPLLSIVSPVYRAADLVEELVQRIVGEVSRITPNFEVVFVDDGSPDDGWQRIAEACARDGRIKGIRLSRNFGQHHAITAALDEVRGRWVVVMDCDLQDDPAYIPVLYRKALEGFDIVYAVRAERAHGSLRNASSRLFAHALSRLSSDSSSDPRVGTYSLISRDVVEAFRKVADAHRHYLLVLRWLGFRSAEVPTEHAPRLRGRSSYTWWTLARHALNGLIGYSDRLLYAGVVVGFVLLLATLVGAGFLVASYFVHGFKEGWTSVAVLILLTASAVLLTVGVIGVYVAKIFEQVRQRPLYVVQQRLNCETGASRR